MAEAVFYEHYEVLRRDDGSLWELGRGAMGITYKALDTRLRSVVALKIISAAVINHDIAHQRFLREARAAANIQHPNVASVFHLGEVDGSYFYVMEFIDGETVEDLVRRDGALPAADALVIASQVARALGAAQKQNLVHRDIKPSNIMLVWDEGDLQAKVIDFGLARSVTSTITGDSRTLTVGGFLGTPHYASPEQLDERELDIRSDIYSLGITVFYMLVGRPPFEGSLAQVISQHLNRNPPLEELPDLPAAVPALLSQMLAKSPDERISDLTELRVKFDDCLQECRTPQGDSQKPAPRIREIPRSTEPETTPALYEAAGRVASDPKLAVVLGAGLVLLIIFAIIVMSSTRDAPAPVETAVATETAVESGPELPPAAETSTPKETVATDLLALGNEARIAGDYDLAFQRFRESAEAGNPRGMSALASAYTRGEGTERSWPDAIEWFRRASAQGDPYATYALGECYYFGKGVPADMRTAFSYLATSANENDNFLAQVLLGDIYRSGELDTRDFVEALRLYESAADSGSLDAEAKIGTMIFNGEVIDGQPVIGGPRPEEADHTAAFEIFRRGAARENPLSMYYYAMLLWNGIGVPEPNQELAREQFLLAANAGEVLAQEWCDAQGLEYKSVEVAPLRPLTSELTDAELVAPEQSPGIP